MIAVLAAAALAPGACSRIDYLPDVPITPWPTVVLMHRGGGDDCKGGGCWPNTLPAVEHGLGLVGGVEVDVEISADGTLWLGHDNDVYDCSDPAGLHGGAVVGCFQEMADAAIDAVAYCQSTAPASCVPGSASCAQRYVRLEEVFADLATNHPGAMISLDIKGQYCKALGIEDARHMADEVDRLVRAHGLAWRVMAETSQLAVLDRLLEKGAAVHTFVVSLGEVDGALAVTARQGATGISFKWAPTSEPMNASVVAGIHSKGKRIVLWTINGPADIAAAWRSAPDVIQTDNADFFAFVPTTAGP